MQKQLVQLDTKELLGLTVRTTNRDEFNPETAKIGKLIAHYQEEQIPNKILHRKNPGVTIAAYTEYETDENGEYTYFFGEEVTSFDHIPKGLSSLIIPAGKYQRLTTNPGPFPEVVINAWQMIWKMTPQDLGGKRTYQVDFEVYDHRVQDLQNAVIDIYIGIK